MSPLSESRTFLLQGGTLLTHDDKNHVLPQTLDLLIDGSIIAKIAKDIEVDGKYKIIGCHGKIISPGFIDTHRHLYQTQLKGKHANQTLLEYLPPGKFFGGLLPPDDLFLSQLAGALESIDAGTTTVVDHTSGNPTADHPSAAIQALLTSGIRAIYCYSPPCIVHSWDPWETEDDRFSDETKKTWRDLALAGPFGNGGKVHMGYAIDNLYIPEEILKDWYADLRDPAKGKAKLITTHGPGGPISGYGPNAVQMLAKHNLLGPDILLSHCNFPRDGDGALYAKSGAHFSCTPSTELQMGWPPVALLEDHYEHASLGIDCHSWGSASIPRQMHLLLQHARCKRQEELHGKGMWSRHTGFSVEQVFNLGTLGGAKAVGLEKEIGKLEVGMKADLVIFDGTSPAMLAAAEEDPVAAIVLHSSPGDIEMVFVDGVVRKEGGKLTDVQVAPAPNGGKGVGKTGKTLTWKDVTGSILESREAVNEKMKGIDFKQGEEYVMDKFHLGRKNCLEG